MLTENLNQPSIDFLILADRAEAVNGKLYMMGGGWDHIYVPDFAQQQSISLATGILVPWNATNVNHRLAIRVETQDGNELAALGLNFTAGRPPTLGQAESQRVVLSFQLALRLIGPGPYIIKTFLNDRESKSTVFYAQPLPMPPTAVRPHPA